MGRQRHPQCVYDKCAFIKGRRTLALMRIAEIISDMIGSALRRRTATRPMPVDRPAVSETFDRLYRGNHLLSVAYREGQQTRR